MTREHSLLGLGYKRLATLPSRFERVGTIEATGTTLAVAGRAWSDVSSYFAAASSTYPAYSVPKDINAISVRFQTTADDDAHVVEMWGSRGKDHFTLLATLTLTGGTQEGDGSLADVDTALYFVDTIVPTTQNLPQVGKVCDSAANRICRYVVDLCGYDKLVFIATTYAASTELRIDAAGY